MRIGIFLWIFLVLSALCQVALIPAGVSAAEITDSPASGVNGNATVIFFSDPSCPNCAKEMAFLKELEKKYPGIVIKYYEVSKNRELFENICDEYNTLYVGVPRTFVGNKAFTGFSNEDGDLIYYQSYQSYLGYKNQIESAIKGCITSCPNISNADAIEISRNDSLVRTLLGNGSDAVVTTLLVNKTYMIAWWTSERVNSRIEYPNVLVYVDAETGIVNNAVIPNEPIEGIEKPPLYKISWVVVALAALIAIYLTAYIIFKKKIKDRCGWGDREWLLGFCALFMLLLFVIAVTTPNRIIERFANRFPFPVFTAIIALVDGFNPCAFTVLAVLLSLLTHTKSRKKMALIGSVFILTSGLMYFLFIMVLLVIRSELLAEHKDIMRLVVGVLVMIAGIINLKDFFFFGKGVSLGMSADRRNDIFKRGGKIVRDVERANSAKPLILAVVGTIILATLVNLVELGCTFILPMVYLEALLTNFSTSIGIFHYFYTMLYCTIYVLPLFAILIGFIHSFKSERMTEKHGRVLKLAGGLMMLLLGIILIFKPQWLILA